MRKACVALLYLALIGCGGGDKVAPADGEQSQQRFEWKLVTSWPKNFPGLGLAPEHFAEAVERMSNGRLKIKVYGAGQLVPALEVFDAVSQGTAEVAIQEPITGKVKFSQPFFRCCTLWAQRPGDERLAALRRRSRTVARTL